MTWKKQAIESPCGKKKPYKSLKQSTLNPLDKDVREDIPIDFALCFIQ
jgi:hypothetical protein